MHWSKFGALLIFGGSVALGCDGGENPPTTTSNQGGNGGTGGEAGNGGGGSGGGCNHGCPSIGATQCSAETIQSCAPDTNNCRQWVNLLDCASNGKVCDDGVTPVACVDSGTPTCSDGIKNQDETDVDCGGATCNKCDVGEICTQDSDCASGSCDPMGMTCKAADTCSARSIRRDGAPPHRLWWRRLSRVQHRRRLHAEFRLHDQRMRFEYGQVHCCGDV